MQNDLKDFLFESLIALSETFPEAHFRYGYDAVGGSHLVETNPDYLLDGSLGNALWDLEIAALKRFPYELVTFISENSCTVLEVVEKEWIGKAYVRSPQIPTVEAIETIRFFPEDFNSITAGLLKKYAPSFEVPASLPKQPSSISFPMNRSQWSGSILMKQSKGTGSAIVDEADLAPCAQAA